MIRGPSKGGKMFAMGLLVGLFLMNLMSSSLSPEAFDSSTTVTIEAVLPATTKASSSDVTASALAAATDVTPTTAATASPPKVTAANKSDLPAVAQPRTYFKNAEGLVDVGVQFHAEKIADLGPPPFTVEKRSGHAAVPSGLQPILCTPSSSMQPFPPVPEKVYLMNCKNTAADFAHRTDFTNIGTQHLENRSERPDNEGDRAAQAVLMSPRIMEMKGGNSCFIETGTNHGATTMRAAASYASVYSVEKFETFYHENVIRFANTPNVNLILGDTTEELLTLVEAEPHFGGCVYWLDAHNSFASPEWGSNEGGNPLLEELTAIMNSPNNYNALVAIDDFRNFGVSGWSKAMKMYIKQPYPTAGVVKDHVCATWGEAEFMYSFDQVYISPKSLLQYNKQS